MGINLHWIAFSDSEAAQGWNIKDNNHVIRPSGILLYDGHTGGERSLQLSTEQSMETRAAGDLLLTYPKHEQTDPLAQSVYKLFDGRTGLHLPWPVELDKSLEPTGIMQDQLHPDRFLVLTNLATDLRNRNIMLKADITQAELVLLERTAEGVKLIARSKLSTVPNNMFIIATHLAANELGVYGMVDNTPPWLRAISEKWDWTKPWIAKWWPAQVPCLFLFDVTTGRLLSQIRNEIPSLLAINKNNPFYTSAYATGPAGVNVFRSLAAWKLPLAIRVPSVWWSRAAGIVIFILGVGFLRRRLPTYH